MPISPLHCVFRRLSCRACRRPEDRLAVFTKFLSPWSPVTFGMYLPDPSIHIPALLPLCPDYPSHLPSCCVQHRLPLARYFAPLPTSPSRCVQQRLCRNQFCSLSHILSSAVLSLLRFHSITLIKHGPLVVLAVGPILEIQIAVTGRTFSLLRHQLYPHPARKYPILPDGTLSRSSLHPPCQVF